MLPIPLFLVLLPILEPIVQDSASIPTNREIVEEIMEDMKSSDHPENLATYHFISHIYSRNDHQAIWNERNKQLAMEELGKIRLHGLNPGDYRVDELKARVNSTEKNTYQALKTDVLLTYSMIQFGRHMIEGRTDPEYFYDTWHYQRRRYSDATADFLTSCIKTEKLGSYVKHIIPEGGYYDGLMRWMEKYYAGEFENNALMSFERMPIRKGDRSADIVELKFRLSQFGSYSDEEPSDLFDTELESAVKAFQANMGIAADGVVGRETLDALNMTADEKRDMVIVNMERARWLLHNLPEKLLLVNIAGYELYIFDKLQKVYQTPVIVGKIQHETPIFHSDMEYIELNCTWTVPRSIAINEILPSVKKNPDYLSSRHFEVLSNGIVVNPSTINWSSYSSSNLPFVVRQKPGPFNSLGTMKFIFPNNYSVYLHDTPARYLFEKEGTRAFSHGCVRVKDPKALASFILADQGVTESDIDEILASEETQRVYLEKPLPVFLTYWTVFPEFPFNDINTMHFVKDIYGRDKAILEGLRSVN